ncbi:MAG: T9SS type A sorting domain-containing protein [Bacteroidetes bacterium]|nr:T9SS type A sorting domain-containing protein [Bacteroidota bacterium]
MKHIKLLFSISFVFTFVNNINAQISFLDSSTYYTYCDAPSISEGLSFATYSKEFVHLDSVKGQEKFYSILYSSKDWKQHSYVYFLKEKNDTVFFTGTLYNENGDSFKADNLIIYDFSLKVGDTLKIKHTASGLNIKLLIDSVKNVKFQDNQLRRTQFYKILTRAPSEYYRVTSPFFASQGIGSNFGLLPFKLIRRNSPFWQELISVCNVEKVAVYSANSSFDHWKIIDYCDELEIIHLIDTIRSVSIDKIKQNRVKIYPNPAHSFLQIEYPQGSPGWEITITNINGKAVLQSKENIHQISTKHLPNGIYYIQLTNKKFYHHETHKIIIQH